MLTVQVLPDVGTLCTVCFACAVGCETVGVEECKLADDVDNACVDEDRVCASPSLLDGLLGGVLCDEVDTGWEVGSADTFLGVSA